MKNALPLSEDKKLSLTYRVEPGCLGPDGKKHIDNFCGFAQESIQSLGSDYITFSMVPRNDKTLAELQYSVVGKNMNHSQAEKYLEILGKSLDDFEGLLDDKLAECIDEYMVGKY